MNYRLGPGADQAKILGAQARLGLEFPEPVIELWSALNGLEVQDPPFQILPLDAMTLDRGYLVFCMCNRSVRLGFDTRTINEAGQWNIVNVDSGYRLTLTIGSFWSMHMWTWVVKWRPIWFAPHVSG